MKRMAITLALVGASTIGLANTSHAMTLPTPSALKEAVPSNTSQVFWRGGGWGGGWRGGGWGPGIGFGIAAGALTAAAVASTPYWGGGYWGGYPGYGLCAGYAMRRHMAMRRRPTPTPTAPGLWIRTRLFLWACLRLLLWNQIREPAGTLRLRGSGTSPSLRQHFGLRRPYRTAPGPDTAQQVRGALSASSIGIARRHHSTGAQNSERRYSEKGSGYSSGPHPFRSCSRNNRLDAFTGDLPSVTRTAR